MAVKGAFTFVLHGHLPYVVAHGRWPHGMDWLNEAAAETYIPLLDAFWGLVEEGISPKVTMGLTPVLCEQLRHPDFVSEFKEYLAAKIKASERDEAEFAATGRQQLVPVARMWREFYSGILQRFEGVYGEDVVGAFARLQDGGHIEIITCAATHGYLPLLGEDTSVQAQIRAGVHTYRRHFGREPRGIWLPECAYRPRYRWRNPLDPEASPVLRKGVEEFLSEERLRYFIIDTPLLRGGRAIGVYIERFEALRELWRHFEAQYKPAEEDVEKSPYELYLVGSTPGRAPVAVFTRDPKTGLQVWSGEHGYPGDGWYLDFHKKHFPGGNRYWRVTSAKSDLADKQPYEPGMVESRLTENADHFTHLVVSTLQAEARAEGAGDKHILCAPYDAELFGHWWFEGPRWLVKVLRNIARSGEVELRTCAEHLERARPSTVISLPEGSWGQGGFHWIWLNDWTKWTWKHIYEAEARMRELASRYAESADERVQSILRQLARELLLLEASDWQFLISTWSARDYAELRVSVHYENFTRLARMLESYASGGHLEEGEWTFLGECEKRDAVFPDVDPRWWAKVDYPPGEE